MRRPLLLAATAALALTACQKADTANTADANIAFDANSTVADNGDADAAVDANDEAVEMAEVPAPAAGVTAADAAPLTTAQSTEQAIERGTGIRRVRQGDGWAWYEGDRVVRTASGDGKRVSYFRAGEARPYLVHDDDEWFGYQNGEPQRRYGRDGKPERPSADQARHAVVAEQRARDDHDGARDDHAGPTGRDDRTPPNTHGEDRGARTAGSGDHDTRTPTPTGRDDRDSRGGPDRRSPQPTPSATARGHDRRGGDHRPTPRATATPDTGHAQQDHRP